MAKFTKGNKMWQLRSKIGRDMLFSSPELMEDAAAEYFQWCDDNPWKRPDYKVVKNKLEFVELSISRPYTWQGLTRYLNCDVSYFSNFKRDRSGKLNSAFSQVIAAIESVIYQQKFEGAAVGAFNANIISRDLGLADKRDITNNTIVVNQPDDDENGSSTEQDDITDDGFEL